MRVKEKGELSILDELDKLVESLSDANPIDGRININFRVMLKLLLVEDCVGTVWFDQKINVEVYEREDAGFESGRGVNVAVEL
jgi:hypothetical protein